jgi:DNA-binding NtrC family response regulator
MNRVLVVDDDAAMRVGLEASFRKQGWLVETASGVNDALFKFRAAPTRLVVTDMRMQDGDGLDVMQGIRALSPDTPIIFLTAYGTVPEAVHVMKGGAWDYLTKPVAFSRLEEVARRVLGNESESKNTDLGTTIVGPSEIFQSVVRRARHVARTEADILIESESGTGKELIARLIHDCSERAAKPFVAVNCSAFPENLLESELFGHVRGAFTGASVTKAGKFEIANGGTLLLDEIGEMPLSLQPKLLRVLQEREVDRLGDTRPIKVDVRIIATTNRPLLAELETGRFRGDLYYRLNVIPLCLPPLRERREDIAALAEHFLRKHEPKSRRGQYSVCAEAMQALKSHDWPGNVRELENSVRRALALAQGVVLGAELFRPALSSTGTVSAQGSRVLAPGLTLAEAERRLVETTLAATGGNRTRAAELMGVSLRTMRNKIREFGLPPRSNS